MDKDSIIRYWKDPINRSNQSKDVPINPVGDTLKELSDLEKSGIAGGADPNTILPMTQLCTFTNCRNISKAIGNKGYVCTLTVECMPSCN